MSYFDPALVRVGYEALQPHLPDEPGWSVVVMVKAVLRAVTPTIREQKMAAADIAFLDAVAARERLEQVRGGVQTLLDEAKKQRDAMGPGNMHDDAYGYGERMWAAGRVTGIAEVLFNVLDEATHAPR